MCMSGYLENISGECSYSHKALRSLSFLFPLRRYGGSPASPCVEILLKYKIRHRDTLSCVLNILIIAWKYSAEAFFSISLRSRNSIDDINAFLPAKNGIFVSPATGPAPFSTHIGHSSTQRLYFTAVPGRAPVFFRKANECSSATQYVIPETLTLNHSEVFCNVTGEKNTFIFSANLMEHTETHTFPGDPIWPVPLLSDGRSPL